MAKPKNQEKEIEKLEELHKEFDGIVDLTAKIINPSAKCIFCNKPIVNSIVRKENGMTLIYSFEYAQEFSKLLCDAHMKSALSSYYTPLEKAQTDQLGNKLKKFMDELVKQTKAINPEIYKRAFKNAK